MITSLYSLKSEQENISTDIVTLKYQQEDRITNNIPALNHEQENISISSMATLKYKQQNVSTSDMVTPVHPDQRTGRLPGLVRTLPSSPPPDVVNILLADELASFISLPSKKWKRTLRCQTATEIFM